MEHEVSKAKAQKKTDAIFVLACARGYLADVQALLEQGAHIEAADKQKISALHFACGQGRSQIVHFLWSKGIDLDIEDPSGNLPIHHAVSRGKEGVVEVLLTKGAWTEGSNAADDTVLHLAARKGDEAILRMLLQYGAKPILKDVNKRGLTAFGEAILSGHLGSAKLLHQGGSQHEHKCNHWTLLHVCTQLGWEASVKYLLEAGAEVNMRGLQDGDTALHCAARTGNVKIARVLLQNGADSTICNALNERPVELVKSNAELQKLLAVKNISNTPPALQRLGPRTELDLFKAASSGSRLEKVSQWAAIDDEGQLKTRLEEFPMELINQLGEVKKLQQVSNIQKIIVELLDNDDFQQQASEPATMKAVADVQKDQQAFRRHVETHPDILPFLQTLQRFQAVVRVNGNHNVPLQSVLRSSEQGYHEKSKQRLKGLDLMLLSRKRAAVAAALADTEAEARQAVEQTLDPRNDSSPKSTSHHGEPKPASRSSDAQPATIPNQPRVGKAKSINQELDEYGLPPLPPPEPFSWKRLLAELRRSLVMTCLVFVVFSIFMYSTTGRFPWQDQEPEVDPTAQNESPQDYEL